MSVVTIPGVPILRTGTYALASGPRVFAEEDLRAAADALASDPAVKAPRIKIDALAKSWGLDPEAHGGEPAFGWADNLTVSDNGQELLADFHVPDWLAAAMEWAYPSLSIEGPSRAWESPTGKTHEFVITAVALLGTDWPGCTTLDDFREILASGPEVMDEPAEEMIVARMPTQVRASLDSDLVVRRFYDALDEGELLPPADEDGPTQAGMLWVRSMRFDDSGRPYLKVTDESDGDLWRIDFDVSGADVTFGEWVAVVEQDVPIAASAPRPAPPVRVWASMADSRPNATTEDDRMPDLDLAKLRERLGLPEDADEQAINAALAADPPADPPPPAAVTPPEGMVLVDEGTLSELRQGAEQAAAVAARLAREDRERVIAAAIGEGRFPVGRREHYEKLYDGDPEGTTTLLTASAADGGLAPGAVPVGPEAGRSGDGDNDPGAEEAQHQAYMEQHFPQVVARLRNRQNGGGRIRVRTEV